MTQKVTMGNRLRQLREKEGLSQTQVANLIDKTLKTYQRYERDETIPSVDTAIYLADYYKVTVKYLAGRSDNSERN